MKRLWIGAGLLVALLIAGLWSMRQMEHIHSEISDALAQTAAVLAEDDWQQADGLLASAQGNWDRHKKFTASMADHTTLDEIEALFAQAEVYRLKRAAADCAASCARLSRQIAALDEGNHLSWWNLL